MRGAIFAGLAAGAVSVLGAIAMAADAPEHFANADDAKAVLAGKIVYQQNCASCHGRYLEGQALWQLDDRYAGRRAPAQDATGHTWQHSDDDLLYMTKNGRFPEAPKDAVSYMPAFGTRLTDAQILDVLAYIKSSWPTGIRVSQAMLNPGLAGMPADADKVEWTLPPNCTEAYRRWRVISR